MRPVTKLGNIFVCIIGVAVIFICISFSKTIYYDHSRFIRQFSLLNTNKKLTDILKHKSDSSSKTGSLTIIPKVIYMFWDNGWEHTELLQKLCLRSFQRQNKDFVVRPLNMSEAEALIDRRKHYSDEAWNFAKVQAKSDIIRVEVLGQYGGVWADASVYCNEPLSNWLTDDLLRADFFAYERRDSGVNSDNSPFIASWFLATPKDSFIIQTWLDHVRKAWSQKPYPPQTLRYYWVHRLFRYLIRSNSTFRSYFERMPFYDAGGPHCNHPENPTPHVYKMKSGSCWRERKQLYHRENKTNSLGELI